jgi:ABC-type xylose transport system permease subunit
MLMPMPKGTHLTNRTTRREIVTHHLARMFWSEQRRSREGVLHVPHRPWWLYLATSLVTCVVVYVLLTLATASGVAGFVAVFAGIVVSAVLPEMAWALLHRDAPPSGLPPAA